MSNIQGLVNWQDWQIATIMISMIALFASVAVYMISQILRMKELEHTAKKEMLEGMANVVFAAFVISFITVIDDYTKNFMVEIARSIGILNIQNVNNIRSGEIAAGIASAISVCIINLLPFAQTLYYLSVFQTSTLTIRDIVIGPDLDFVVSISESLMNIILQITFLHFVWIKILLFGAFVGPSLIAIGFPLRALPFSRGAGSYLIAMGTALYFVMPIAYVISINIFFTNLASCNPSLTSIEYGPLNNVSMLATIKYVITHAASFISNFNMYFFELVKNFCITPLFALAITLTFSSIFSSFLGSRLSEIGRGLIKLI
jgi:hypothetical protein